VNIVAEGMRNFLGGGRGGDMLTVTGSQNTLYSQSGEDTLRSLAGGNTLESGHHNDTIFAQNGHKDRINCGPQVDTVTFDQGLDELEFCEIKNP
jgi:Ca2+-binding RTX toxin-like protein